ncbi:MAG: ABC transporter ATP-binding protein [Alphaproteobacteria bacterium]|nr:ABC transporter ATP-binding protein [Alphaproteobacteria bacterium]
MTSDVIVAESISKRFRAVTALETMSLRIAGGKTTGLLGGNGAGKTTTMAILLGLLRPSSGRIEIFGLELERHRYELLPRMNFSSPYVDLPHRLTALENLRVYARLYGVRRPEVRIAELAEALDIGALLRRPVGKLSAGQRTRIALAKALINRPALLLLDEPTASLDPDTADWVRSYLERYRTESGATILLASHNMAEVERLCDDVIMLKAGRLVDRGSPTELIARYGRHTMEEVFLDIAREGARAQ